MKRYYVVSTYQAFILCLMSALFSASAVVAASFLTYWVSLPEVTRDQDGKCVRVASRKNGEAFQCQDVDVLLREYRVLGLKQDK